MNRFTGVLRAVMALTLVCVAVGCIPSERGATVEIKRASDTHKAKVPVLPRTNPSPEQMERAIDFDLRNRPDSQDFWTPTRSEADCVAKEVVNGIGTDRLSALGYQPGTPGAGLVDLALTTEERAKLTSALTGCVDMREAIAALYFGKGRVSVKAAGCLADILDKTGFVPAFFAAWANGSAVDPFAQDAHLADSMSAAAQICLSPNDLNWPTLRSPVEDQGLIDADLPPGSRDSNHPDDRRLREKESN